MARFPQHTNVVLDEGKFGRTELQIIDHVKKNGEVHYKTVVLNSDNSTYTADSIEFFPANEYDHKFKPQ